MFINEQSTPRDNSVGLSLQFLYAVPLFRLRLVPLSAHAAVVKACCMSLSFLRTSKQLRESIQRGCNHTRAQHRTSRPGIEYCNTTRARARDTCNCFLNTWLPSSRSTPSRRFPCQVQQRSCYSYETFLRVRGLSYTETHREAEGMQHPREFNGYSKNLENPPETLTRRRAMDILHDENAEPDLKHQAEEAIKHYEEQLMFGMVDESGLS
jgi:hypothetical protein